VFTSYVSWVTSVPCVAVSYCQLSVQAGVREFFDSEAFADECEQMFGVCPALLFS
jgi:hypothetical protein